MYFAASSKNVTTAAESIHVLASEYRRGKLDLK